ncbi:hypothetical protein BC827DRAFT_1232327 [Russula dissimulans]|nr:hypothetical protein BC827DRAFT_1232327 [Russula dissimulans]
MEGHISKDLLLLCEFMALIVALPSLLSGTVIYTRRLPSRRAPCGPWLQGGLTLRWMPQFLIFCLSSWCLKRLRIQYSGLSHRIFFHQPCPCMSSCSGRKGVWNTFNYGHGLIHDLCWQAPRNSSKVIC